MHSNLLVKKNILINPFIYSRILICIFLKESTLKVMVIYNLAFSQRSVYLYSWWNVLFLSFRREHPHGEFGDQEWLQPQTIHKRWSRRYVIKTSRSKRFFNNFCVFLFRNTSDHWIVWSVMGTYIAYLFIKDICLCAVWLAAISAVFELLSRQPNHLCKNEDSIKVKSFLKFLKSNSYISDRGWVRMT